MSHQPLVCETRHRPDTDAVFYAGLDQLDRRIGDHVDRGGNLLVILDALLRENGTGGGSFYQGRAGPFLDRTQMPTHHRVIAPQSLSRFAHTAKPGNSIKRTQRFERRYRFSGRRCCRRGNPAVLIRQGNHPSEYRKFSNAL